MAGPSTSTSLPSPDNLPHYLRDDFTTGPPMPTPSPFKFVSGLEERKLKPEGEDSFKFDQPRQSSAPAEIKFPPVQPETSTSAFSVSLRSWSKDNPSQMSVNNRKEPLASDSLVFDPKATIPEKAFSDSNVTRPQTLKTNLRSAESLPLPPRSKFPRWRWLKRNPFNLHPMKSDIVGMNSIDEMEQFKSEELKTQSTDIFKDLMESQRRVPESEESTTPSNVYDGPSHEKIIKGHTDYYCRLSPFSFKGSTLPKVVFLVPTAGESFALEPRIWRLVKSFNGYWKMETGGKELYKAQLSHPQLKRLLHRFDSPVRCIMMDSTAMHFRLATWTNVVQHFDQRPWTGEQILCTRGSKKQEVTMSVKLRMSMIETTTKWKTPLAGGVRETYALSEDGQTLTLTAIIEQRMAPKGQTYTTSMAHTVIFSRLQ